MFGAQTFLRHRLASLRSPRLWLAIMVSAGCLILVFRGVQLDRLLTSLGDAEYIWLLPATAMLVVAVVARTLRWQALFHPRTGLRLTTLFNVLNIGYLMNNVLPARAGDLIRAGLISVRESVSTSRALATVVVERVLDVLTVVLLLAALLPVVPVPAQVARWGQVAGGMFGAVALILLVLSTQRVRGVHWTEAVLGQVPRIEAARWAECVGGMIDGLGALQSPAALARAMGWSVVVWLCSALAFYFVMLAFHLSLPLVAGVFVVCVTALGLIVPAPPGYIGVFDYVVVLALAVFDVDRSLALSYALVLHAVTYIVSSGMGLISLGYESLSLGAMLRLKPE